MLTVEVLLHGLLAELPPRRWLRAPAGTGGTVSLVRPLAGPTTVKDLLEAVGIPHCEIGGVLARGKPLSLSHLVEYDTCLEVVSAAPEPLIDPRFICDQHLGALARLLRVMGFDTVWARGLTEPAIVRRALNEHLVVLSRSRGLLKRKALNRAMLVRSDQPDEQAAEVVHRFQLAARVQMFGRCTACNGQVQPVAKEAVRDRIPPRTALWLDEYFICRDCDRLYWEGTHVLALKARLAAIIPPADPPPDRS
jgi:uncharacterized protein with PIN domain